MNGRQDAQPAAVPLGQTLSRWMHPAARPVALMEDLFCDLLGVAGIGDEMSAGLAGTIGFWWAILTSASSKDAAGGRYLVHCAV
jgi:hypothetical protein